MAVPKLTPDQINKLNQWEAYTSFKETWFWTKLIHCPARIRALFCGNRFGKTATIAREYVLRAASLHPCPDKNFNLLTCNPENIWKSHRQSLRYYRAGQPCPKCGKPLQPWMNPCRIVRCASENLPGESDDAGGAGTSAELKNTQYPALKKWLPPYLIKKDINARNKGLRIHDFWGGADITFEFVSYNQLIQSQAGVPRFSIWYDEHAPWAFYDENRMRIMDTGGDIIMGLTPAVGLAWEFDEIFSRARKYYRTETIAKAFDINQEEVSGLKTPIAVFQAASDDNPTIPAWSLKEMFAEIADPDEMAIRRYGIFRQVSTTIYKEFSFDPHFQPMEKWFPEGVPQGWLHARSIDWHPVVRLAQVAMSLSEKNELFIWWENNPSPQKICTEDWAEELARGTFDYSFRIDRIDPLATTKRKEKTDEGDRTTSVCNDLNDTLRKLAKKGIGSGGSFIGYDTKGTRGREQLKTRLKNSKICGEPFNNKRVDDHGNEYCLPTVWVMDTCPLVAKSLKNWRLEEANPNDAVRKDENETPQQKWSHFCTAIEGILKETLFRPPREWDDPDEDRRRPGYLSRPGARRTRREIHDGVREVREGVRGGRHLGGNGRPSFGQEKDQVSRV